MRHMHQLWNYWHPLREWAIIIDIVHSDSNVLLLFTETALLPLEQIKICQEEKCLGTVLASWILLNIRIVQKLVLRLRLRYRRIFSKSRLKWLQQHNISAPDFPDCCLYVVWPPQVARTASVHLVIDSPSFWNCPGGMNTSLWNSSLVMVVESAV